MAKLILTDSQKAAYREAVLASGPAIYLPLDSADGLTDLTGNYTATGAGSITAGTHPDGPLADPNDLGATDFDGTDDRITTDYGTRRNLCTNPRGAVDTTGVTSSGLATMERIASPPTTAGLPTNFPDTGCFHFVGNSAGDQAYWSVDVTSGVTYTMSFYGRITSETGGAAIQVRIADASNSAKVFSEPDVTAVGGDFERISATVTADSTGTWRFGAQMGGGTALDYHVTGVFIEQSASVGTYFDGTGYVSEDTGNWISDPGGHVGWLGTAHASASDRGVFSNGTTRTFCGWAYRDDDSGQMMLIGRTGTGTHTYIGIQSGSGDTIFSPGPVGSTWTGAWPGSAEWVHWALVFDEPNDAVSLYLNGSLISTKTNAGQFTAHNPNAGVAGNFNVGVYAGNVSPFDGKMQGVAVYERGLTAGEIAELYAAASEPTRSYDFLETAEGIYAQREGITLPTVTRDNTWAEGSDAEGRERVRSRPQNSEAGKISLYFSGDTAAAFYDALDDLQEIVEAAHRNKGTLIYQPPSGTSVTYDLEAIDLTAMPQDGVMLARRHAAAELAFEVKPYGRLPRVSLVNGETLSGPIDAVVPSDVPGQVDAWARLELLDDDTEDRNHLEVGVQHDYDPDNAEPLVLEAITDVDAVGGSSTTRSGSEATNVIRTGLSTVPVICAVAEDQPHAGRWKVRARVYATTDKVRIRLAWRSGVAPFARERWVTVPAASGWYDLDLGTVNIPELPSDHTADFRLEAASTSGVPTVDLDILTLIPADRLMTLRGSTTEDVASTAVVAADDFSTHSSAALSGTTPLLAPSGNWAVAGTGGTWYTAAGRDAYIEEASGDSDLLGGEFALIGTGTQAAVNGKVKVQTEHRDYRSGLILRYTDVDNYLFAGFTRGNAFTLRKISLIKVVSGTATVLNEVDCLTDSWIYAGCDASGNAAVLTGPDGNSWEWRILSLGDSDLATAGTLETGRYGLYHTCSTSAGSTARFDDLAIIPSAGSVSVTNPAVNADYSLSLRHNTALTDSSGGEGVTPVREGRYLTLPPAGRGGRQCRVVVRARRDDVDGGFEDAGLSDTLTANLTVTPRVHLTGQ